MSVHITIIGGDMRYVRLAMLLAADGHTIRAFGMDAAPPPLPVLYATDLTEALHNAECVVLPIPMFSEGDALNMPLARNGLRFAGLIDHLRPDQLILAGRISPATREQAVKRGIIMTDFLDREEMAVANAVPTAFAIGR
jgi:dipicolinate synthase subunit A